MYSPKKKKRIARSSMTFGRTLSQRKSLVGLHQMVESELASRKLDSHASHFRYLYIGESVLPKPDFHMYQSLAWEEGE